ncbi:hypothetical protein [Persicobacter diffluens]|uniref:Uncharacterized protein n=1 Tax=Persicobacter diffluens TaxID=981 RepID=A0AAN4W1A3_9BACT|nr:hypothetical protein PEDI_36010 [Persicobacter diffluens]
MKKFTNLFLFGLIYLLLCSCARSVDSSELTMDAQFDASIKIYAKANLDLSTPNMEDAPAGCRFVLSADYSDFNSNASGRWYDTLTLNENGYLETAVKVSAKGVHFDLEPVDFEANQKQGINSNVSEINKIFKADELSFTLVPSQAKIETVEFYGETIGDEMDMVDVTFFFRAYTDEDEGMAALPSDFEVVFKSSNSSNYWTIPVTSFEVVSNDNSTYSKAVVSVPKSHTIKVMDFYYDLTTEDGPERQKYYNNSTFSYSSNGLIQYIDFNNSADSTPTK